MDTAANPARCGPALILAMFLTSAMPGSLAERQARLWMAERLRERGDGTPAG
jgi:hypothetical protein